MSHSSNCSSTNMQEGFNVATSANTLRRPLTTTRMMIPPLEEELNDIGLTGLLPTIPPYVGRHQARSPRTNNSNGQGKKSRNELRDILSEALDIIDPNDFLDISDACGANRARQ